MLLLSEKIKFLEKIFGHGQLDRKNNFAIYCPFCNHPNKEKKKLSIHLEKLNYHCWVCGKSSRSLSFLIKKFGSHSDFLEYKRSFNVEDTDFRDSKSEEKSEDILPEGFSLLVENLGSKDPDTKSIFKYLIKKRGLTEKLLWKYKIGFSHNFQFQRKVIIPSFDKNGLPNYYLSRKIDDDSKFRYQNSTIDKISIVFNELNIDWTKKLILSEGFFDMVKCGDNVSCLLGSTLDENHELFNQIVLHDTKIILALDADMQNTNLLRIVKKMNEYNIENTVLNLGDKKDPGEMSQEEIDYAILTAKKLEWDQIMKRKMKMIF